MHMIVYVMNHATMDNQFNYIVEEYHSDIWNHMADACEYVRNGNQWMSGYTDG